MDVTRLITIFDAISVLDYATDRVDFNTFTYSEKAPILASIWEIC